MARIVPLLGSHRYRALSPSARPSRAVVIVKRRPTSVRLEADTAAVTLGEPVHLQGTVRPAGLRAVALQRTTGAGRWSAVASVRTTRTGVFAFDDTPPVGDPRYRVVAGATRAAAAGASGEVAVHVAPPAPAPTTGALTVTVTGLPAGVPAVVTVQGPDTVVPVSQTTTLSDVPAGSWSVVADPVAIGTDDYYAAEPTQTTVLVPAAAATVVVDYAVVVPETTTAVPVEAIASVTDTDGLLSVEMKPAAAAAARRTTARRVVEAAESPTVDDNGCMSFSLGGVRCPGDYVAIGITRDLPYGGFGRIPANGVTSTGFTLDTTHGATLTQALKANITKKRDLSLERTGSQQLTHDLSCKEGGTGHVDGSFSVQPSLNVTADWDLTGLRSAEVSAQIDQTASVVASISASGTCTLAPVTVSDIYLTPVTFQIGPLPVVVRPELTVEVDGSAEATGEISTSWEEEFHGKAGVRWNGSGFERVVDFQPPSATGHPPTFDGELNATIRLTPKLTALFYGVAGPSVGLHASLNAQAKGTVDPSGARLDWALTGALEAFGRFDMPLLDRSSDELTMPIKEWDLASGTVAWGDPGPAPQIATAELPHANVGLAYSARLETTDNRNGRWTVAAGALPRGLSLDPDTGVISGTPTAVGDSAFTARFTDPQTRADDQDLTMRVDPGPVGTTTDWSTGYSQTPDVSEDGAWTTYVGYEYVDGVRVPVPYLRSASGEVQRVGALPDPTRQPLVMDLAISGDGNVVVYTRSLMTAGVRTYEVVRHVRTSGAETVLCQDCSAPSVSRDGSTVAFVSASALVPTDQDDQADVYTWGAADGALHLQSQADSGVTAAAATNNAAALSSNGRWLVFSGSGPLTTDDDNGFDDVYRRDLRTGELARVSSGSDADGGSADAGDVADDGSVAFYRWGTYGYFYDAATGSTARIPDRYAQGGPYGYTYGLRVTPDGQHVAYTYNVPYEEPYSTDVYVWDRSDDRLTLVSWPDNDTDVAGWPAITADGDTVVYGVSSGTGADQTSAIKRWTR